MLDDHYFVRIISGQVKIIQSNTSRLFGPGYTILFPRLNCLENFNDTNILNK